jgi:hypothetical protein
MVLLFFSNFAFADDTIAQQTFSKQHALYDKVTSDYSYIDSYKATDFIYNKNDVKIYYHYFNQHENILFSCTSSLKDDKNGICFDLSARGDRLKPRQSEIEYGKKINLKPVDRYMTHEVAILEVKEPFSQFSIYVWYVGNGRVVKCRSTFTKYSFEFEREDQTIYIESSRSDEFKHKCNDLYPRK